MIAEGKDFADIPYRVKNTSLPEPGVQNAL